MKKGIALVLCFLMLAALLPNVLPHIAQADDRFLEINETNFPDGNFRNWITGNLTVSGDAGTGYYMTEAQVAAVESIDCFDQNISSLNGIEHFTALTELSFENNYISALDVSKNTALASLNCASNQLTVLDVSKNTALASLECSGNLLTALDLSENTAIESLNCNGNQLTALDVSGNSMLTKLLCSFNQLTALNVGSNTTLEYLDCIGNQLTELDVSKNTALTELRCSNNQLTALDLSKNTALRLLYCDYNQLISLDLSHNASLINMNCIHNKLTAIDVSNSTALQFLFCGYNRLTSLDVSGNTALQYFSCPDNRLTVLDVSRNTELEFFVAGNQVVWNQEMLMEDDVCTYDLSSLVPIECMSNVTVQDASNMLNPVSGVVTFPLEINSFTYLYATGYSDMDVTVHFANERYLEINETDFPDDNFRNWIINNLTVSGDADTGYYMTEEQTAAVTTIDCSDQNIASLTGIEYFTALKTLKCHFNQISTLDLSGNTELNILNAHHNQINTLNIGNCEALTQLYCNVNQLTELDVRNNTALTTIYCGDNKLTALDVSKNPALGLLSCFKNQLTELDISGNTALETLVCDNNQLTALNVSQNTSLSSLNCSSNQLTALDVSNNTALYNFSCNFNQLTALDVSSNTALQYLYSSNNSLQSLDVSRNTALITLSLSNNQLTALDVSNNPALIILYCKGNQLTELDVSNNTTLSGLYCSSNQLTALDLDNNTALTTLDCRFNRLAALDLSNHPSLSTVSTEGQMIEDRELQSVDGVCRYDLKELVPIAWMANVTMEDASNVLDPVTGVVAFPDEVESFRYLYATGRGDMPVEVYFLIAPSIKTQPKSQTVADGKTAEFTVEAGGTAPQYQWYYSKDNGENWKKLSGKTTETLSVKASATTNGYLYRCQVKNEKGSVTSKSAKLTVSGVKPKIIVQPKAATVKSGKSNTFKVVAAGSGLKYQWYYSKDNGTKWIKLSGKTSASLKIKGSATTNGYLYRCIVKNSKGSVTSKSVKLTVSGVKPKIIVQPKAVSVKSGKTAKFSVVAAGTGLKYQWYYSKNAGKTWTKWSGKTAASVSLKAAKAKNGYLYRCVVKNTKGSVTSKNAKLTVK